MTGNISNKVLEATELEPTYRAVEDRVDPLGLLLLLEKVCTKNSINNVEALRTEWQNLTYSDGMCIFAYMNRFDALVKNIDRASGTGEKVRDCDKVYRLRQAIPESTARVLLVTAFAHEKGDKEYPSYDWGGRAYRVDVDPYAVGEDDPQPIEGNYLANWTGRCSVAAKHEEPDESEVDYTPDTPKSESQEDEVREDQSQEAEETTAANTIATPTPVILPDPDSATAPASLPPHTLTFNGRQWTMAELEALTAQQNDTNAKRLRAAGWGVLNSKAPKPPTLSPPLPQAPAILETETTLAHPAEGAAESSASPASVLPEETPAPAPAHVPQAEPELPSETAWSTTARIRIRAQRDQKKNIETEEAPITLDVWVAVKNCRSRDPKDYTKLYNAVMSATQPYWNDPLRWNSYKYPAGHPTSSREKVLPNDGPSMAKRELQRREKETESRERRLAERQEKDAQGLQRMKDMLTQRVTKAPAMGK
ncbi:hypothetical protein B484DRAFT_405936 [Ochromonadaceae sp. CCMP2298]|nr:hypothetical protein B484DRAFT_405936 [Ochromonadaceae sp. CCMP2298]